MVVFVQIVYFAKISISDALSHFNAGKVVKVPRLDSNNQNN